MGIKTNTLETTSTATDSIKTAGSIEADGDAVVGGSAKVNSVTYVNKNLTVAQNEFTNQVTLTNATSVTVFDPLTEFGHASWAGKMMLCVANWNDRFDEVFIRNHSNWLLRSTLSGFGSEFVYDESGSTPVSWTESKYNFYLDESILKCYNNTGTTRTLVYKAIKLLTP